MLKYILLTLAAILAIILIVAAFQPSSYRIERKATVTLPPAVVFAHVNDFHHWQKFNPFTDPDPNVRLTYEGAPVGEGAIYKWKGNSQVGQGEMTIVESRPHEHIRIDMHFIEPFENRAAAHFHFKPEGNGTEVTWTMEGNNNFLGKCFGLFMDMDKMIGGQFEKGLARMNNFDQGPVSTAIIE